MALGRGLGAALRPKSTCRLLEPVLVVEEEVGYFRLHTA
jgi:hypothetical protein